MNLDRLRLIVREMGCVRLCDLRSQGVTTAGWARIRPVTLDARHPRYLPTGFIVIQRYNRLRAAVNGLNAGWDNKFGGTYSRDRIVSVVDTLDDLFHVARLHGRLSVGDEYGTMVVNGESTPNFGGERPIGTNLVSWDETRVMRSIYNRQTETWRVYITPREVL